MARNSDLFINEDGQFVLLNGDLAFVQDVDQVAQNIRFRLKTFRGEWFLDNSLGVDWYGVVFVKTPDMASIQREILTQVEAVENVSSVVDYKQSLDSVLRILSVSFTALLDTGQDLNFQGVFP
jgi:hypothetical protein